MVFLLPEFAWKIPPRIFFEHAQASLQGMANVYDYRATQSQFDGDNKETTDISARVTIFCISGQHPVKTSRKKSHKRSCD